MRAVWVGLVGAVLAVGGAQAASCVKVVDNGMHYAGQPVVRPDLIGQTFTVGRYVNTPEMIWSEPRQAQYNVGSEAYELKGAAESFVIHRYHVDGVPSVNTKSAPLQATKVDWSAAGKKAPPPNGDDFDYVYDGPLTSLALVKTACH